MDVTTKAVALRASDYRENDKMVLLYSLEYGKISVHAKGVRKSAAKLKFACDQFCFGKYELAQNGDRLTLKNCDQLQSFYELREDVARYYAACAVAETLINYTEEWQSDGALFVCVLKSFQQLCAQVQPLCVLLKFLLDFLRLEGFALTFDSCVNCGEKTSEMFLDVERGGVVCRNCRSGGAVALSAAVVSACTMVENLPYEKLKNLSLPQQVLKEALTLCLRYLSHSFRPLNSLAELLNVV